MQLFFQWIAQISRTETEFLGHKNAKSAKKFSKTVVKWSHNGTSSNTKWKTVPTEKNLAYWWLIKYFT